MNFVCFKRSGIFCTDHSFVFGKRNFAFFLHNSLKTEAISFQACSSWWNLASVAHKTGCFSNTSIGFDMRSCGKTVFKNNYPTIQEEPKTPQTAADYRQCDRVYNDRFSFLSHIADQTVKGIWKYKQVWVFQWHAAIIISQTPVVRYTRAPDAWTRPPHDRCFSRVLY